MGYLEETNLLDGTDSQWTKDRQAAILWARNLLSGSFLLLDTETTGLNTNTSEIVQISVVCNHGGILLDTLVKPSGLIPKEATAIHHITNEMVQAVPTWQDVFPKLLTVIRDQKVIIYNFGYDWPLITSLNKRTGIDNALLFGAKVECAMLKYSAYIGEPGKYGDYRWQKLTGGDHTAKGDCLATLELIKRMSESGV
jgi:DNA polymerase-3 subunit epsilon